MTIDAQKLLAGLEKYNQATISVNTLTGREFQAIHPGSATNNLKEIVDAIPVAKSPFNDAAASTGFDMGIDRSLKTEFNV